MKKTLRTIFIERTDTIDYRAIKKQLITVAQNGGNSILQLSIESKTITSSISALSYLPAQLTLLLVIQ
jgi:hypothetical protein